MNEGKRFCRKPLKMISNHEGRSVESGRDHGRLSAGGRTPEMPPLRRCWFVRQWRRSRPPPPPLPCRHCAASSLPPRLCRRRPPSTKHQIRSRRENGGRGDRPNRAPLSSSLPFPSFPSWPACLTAPASGGFWDQIRVISRKIFCSESLKAFAAVL